MATKKLTKSAQKSLAGVCGGLAEYLNVDPTVVRVIYLALSIFTTGFPGLILYIILALVMPEKNANDNDKYEEAQVVE